MHTEPTSQPSRPKKPRSKKTTSIAILALFAVALYALQAISVRRLVSPTRLVRDPATLADIRGPAPQKPEPDWSGLGDIKVSDDPTSRDGVSLKTPTKPDQKSAAFRGYERHELNHGERLRLSTGELFLHQVAVGFETETDKSMKSPFVSLEPVVYNGNLEPTTEEPPEMFPGFHRIDYLTSRGPLPTARFVFKLPGIQDFKLFQARMIDATTGAELGYGSQESIENETLTIESSFLSWTARPFDLVLDFAHDASEPEKHELIPGFHIETPTADLQFVTLRPGKLRYQSYGSNINFRQESFGYEPSTSAPGANAAAVFVGFPTARFVAANFAFLDANGIALESMDDPYTRTLTSLKSYPISASIDTIKYLEVRRLQHARRVIFHFPGLPGLPEPTGKSRKNFFETQIPYMRISDHTTLGDTLAGLTQLELIGAFPPGPQTNYPLYLTNATPKDLLEIYESGLSTKENLYVDLNTFSIEARPGFWIRIRERLTALFE